MVSCVARAQPGRAVNVQRQLPRKYVLSAMIALAFAPQSYGQSSRPEANAEAPSTPLGSVEFDPDFFPGATVNRVDISRFSKAGYVPPGTYRADIVFNGDWRAREDVVFAAKPGSDDVQLCLDAKRLARYGADLKKIADAAAQGKAETMPLDQFCAPLNRYVPDATTDFDAGKQELNVTVPQIYALRQVRGYVDPSQWDAGITAATVNYNANVYNNSGSYNYSSGYLGLNVSANHGAWHLYHQGALSTMTGSGTAYQATATYLQHDVPAFLGQVTAGDTFTSGELFDSVRVRGVRVATDDRMLPQSLRGFAPVVRGIAETNAHVVIRQNGYLIYETNVAPGAFQIDDLYPTGYGGDLNVEVKEADGRVRRFTVPFSNVAQLLRPGISRWSLTAGQVSELNAADAPKILQGTYQRGITNLVTLYGGATVASGYASVVGGGALNTDMGAFSLDVTQAQQSLPGQSASSGVSVRLGYNKNIVQTGTNLAVAAYRYSTSGFVGLSDMVAIRDAAARGWPADTVRRQRNRIDLNIAQSLGDKGGTFNASAAMRNYWNGSRTQLDFTVGYSNAWRSLTYSINAQRSRDALGAVSAFPGATESAAWGGSGRWDTRVFLTLSVPLGKQVNAPMLTSSYSHGRDGDSAQLGVSGFAGPENRIGYGVNIGRSTGNSSFSANARYTNAAGQFGGNYSQGSGFHQVGASAAGGMIVHGGGVTFAPQVGETVGLVYAPDAAGARVQGGGGAEVDRKGYAVVPTLNPYELNTVTLDPKGMSAGTELQSTTVNVAPRLGSVVKLDYETKAGRAVIVDSQMQDGRPLPFGADVVDENGVNVGVVGQSSRLMLNGLLSSGDVTVRWGEGSANSCRVSVTLGPVKPVSGYERLSAPCEIFIEPGARPAELSRDFGRTPQRVHGVQTKARLSSVRSIPLPPNPVLS